MTTDPVFAAYAGCRILTVDDNMMTLSIVKNMLVELGLPEPETSINGQDAWEKITTAADEKKPYDLVIMDWNMPIMSGYEVLRRCRDESRLARMAIMMVTSENQRRNILEATKAGATSYLIKPVNKDEFREKLGQVFTWLDKMRSVA